MKILIAQLCGGLFHIPWYKNLYSPTSITESQAGLFSWLRARKVPCIPRFDVRGHWKFKMDVCLHCLRCFWETSLKQSWNMFFKRGRKYVFHRPGLPCSLSSFCWCRGVPRWFGASLFTPQRIIRRHDSSKAQRMTETHHHFKQKEEEEEEEDKSATYFFPLCKYRNPLYIKDVNREKNGNAWWIFVALKPTHKLYETIFCSGQKRKTQTFPNLKVPKRIHHHSTNQPSLLGLFSSLKLWRKTWKTERGNRPKRGKSPLQPVACVFFVCFASRTRWWFQWFLF